MDDPENLSEIMFFKHPVVERNTNIYVLLWFAIDCVESQASHEIEGVY